MAEEIKAAVAAYKAASGDHPAWAVYRGDNRPVNGVTEVRGVYYAPRKK